MVRLVLAFFTISFLIGCGDVDNRIKYWKAELTVNIPKGTNIEAVSDYLKSKNLEHSCLPKSYRCFALERDVENYFVVTYSVVMVFNFNTDLKLESYKVDTEGDGP